MCQPALEKSPRTQYCTNLNQVKYEITDLTFRVSNAFYISVEAEQYVLETCKYHIETTNMIKTSMKNKGNAVPKNVTTKELTSTLLIVLQCHNQKLKRKQHQGNYINKS